MHLPSLQHNKNVGGIEGGKGARVWGVPINAPPPKKVSSPFSSENPADDFWSNHRLRHKYDGMIKLRISTREEKRGQG